MIKRVRLRSVLRQRAEALRAGWRGEQLTGPPGDLVTREFQQDLSQWICAWKAIIKCVSYPIGLLVVQIVTAAGGSGTAAGVVVDRGTHRGRPFAHRLAEFLRSVFERILSVLLDLPGNEVAGRPCKLFPSCGDFDLPLL